MTDNEKTVLEKLCDELRAELSTAQLNCDMWHDRAEDMRNRLSAAQAENAKMRKLLTFYLGCLTKGHVNCDSCAFAEGICGHGRKVIDWARELGIEVDE